MTAAATQTRSCAYCGLPLTVSRSARKPVSNDSHHYDSHHHAAEFCCLGCRFAAAVAQERTESGHAHWLMARLAIAAFLSINVMMFSMVLWTRDVYAMDHTAPHTMTVLDELIRYTCLLLTVPVVLLLAGPLIENAAAILRAGRLSTDVLLLVGIAAALAYSVTSVLRDEGHIYFEVACVVLIAVTLGRWFEATGKQRTTAALAALERLLPKSVRVVVDGSEELRPLADVRPSNVLHILAGERIPVDGLLVCYFATIDEQLISGESLPVEKSPGDRVFAGTLNLNGNIYVEADSTADSGTLSRIVEAVRTAAARKDRYQTLADRIAGWFTPSVMVIALATFAYHSWVTTLGDGIMAALAVLLIACPCALALATPMAVWTALGAAAQKQVFFRDGETLVRLAEVRRIAFDKTGTLSTGIARVMQFQSAFIADREHVRNVAAALARGSNHPLSAAVASFASSAIGCRAQQVTETPGLGLTATIEGLAGPAYLGSTRWMSVNHLVRNGEIDNAILQAQNASEAIVCVGWHGKVQGTFTCAETLRDEVPAVIEALRGHDIRLTVLTGDHDRRCESLRGLGLDIRAELLPDDKLAAIDALRHADEQRHAVAMVGDGINDAPALAAADVGIALGCGADVTRETAGVCLLSDDLMRLPWAIDLARRTVRTVRWNLVFAFVYNVVGIALAAAGLLNPILASLAMTASSVLVISNSLRLAHDEHLDQPAPNVDPAQAAGVDQTLSNRPPVGAETP